MNIENCVITNLPRFKDITCNLLTLREIVKKHERLGNCGKISKFQFQECYKSVRNLFFPKKIKKEKRTLHFNKIHKFESIVYLGKGTALHSSWSLGPNFHQAVKSNKSLNGVPYYIQRFENHYSNVYKHGKFYYFNVIKVLTNIIVGFRYRDDLYGLS
jgi:hypothetical protein